ncbi:MAG: HPF/RaiA family ribosome-associated protein [Lysobacterales bacterium]
MLVQVNTDSNIEGAGALSEQVETALRDHLNRHSQKITRVEVHLRDENSDKKPGARDMRCLLEARLAGMQPISVSQRAASLEQAIDGAAEKLRRSLDRSLGRLGER